MINTAKEVSKTLTSIFTSHPFLALVLFAICSPLGMLYMFMRFASQSENNTAILAVLCVCVLVYNAWLLSKVQKDYKSPE